MKTMNRLKDVVQDVLTTSWSDRQIAQRYQCSKTTVGQKRARCAELGLTWADVEPMALSVLRGTLERKPVREEDKPWAQRLDFAAIRKEMEFPGMTLWTYWEEQRELDPNFLSYPRFTALYSEHGKPAHVSMRIKHTPGEQCQVDFSGTQPWYFNEKGEKVRVELFVAAMALSGYLDARCTASQKVPDWIAAHQSVIQGWGVVPHVFVPDNLRSGVSRSGKCPWIQPVYYEMAKHYGSAVHPAQPASPTEKARVEGSVKLVKRAFLPLLRKRRFHSLEELNEALAICVARINAKLFKRRPESRRDVFLRLDRPAMLPLPAEPFRFLQWTAALTVPSDYHVPVEGHYYSVPHGLVGSKVEARVSDDTVQIYGDGLLVATHRRSTAQGDTTTDPEHQPDKHRAMLGRDRKSLLEWAAQVGSATEAVLLRWFDRKVPLQALPHAVALKNLGLRVGPERLERAAQRALALNLCTVSGIERLLRTEGGVGPAPRAATPVASNRTRGPRAKGAVPRRPRSRAARMGVGP